MGMDKKQLFSYIQQREKQYKAGRRKRNVKTLLFFSVVYYAVLWILEDPSGWGLLLNILPAVVLAGVHFLINAIIFSQLVTINTRQQKALEDLRKQLSEMESISL